MTPNIRIFPWQKRTEKPNRTRLDPLLKRRFVLAFDWNYSQVPLEAAKKRYAATSETVVRLKGVWLALALENPVNTTEGRMVSRVLVTPRTIGHSLEELLHFRLDDELEVTVSMLKAKKEEQPWDELGSRDIEYLGVGFLRTPRP